MEGFAFHDCVKNLQIMVQQRLQATEPVAAFRQDPWQRQKGGGGLTAVMEGGTVLEKAGVNTSAVHGVLDETEQAMFLGLCKKKGWSYPIDNTTSFFATGLSIVVHPTNPFIPTSHANVRYIALMHPTEAPLWWIGGGADLTPYYLDEEGVTHFHSALANACNQAMQGSYLRYKQACDDYFYLPHRSEHRGVGGIFYDHLQTLAYPEAVAFSSSVISAYIHSYHAMIDQHKECRATVEQVKWQHHRRSRYAEFNLLYDRGTHFGLKTGGRVASIFMSLPPQTGWVYDETSVAMETDPRLMTVIRQPRDWYG